MSRCLCWMVGIPSNGGTSSSAGHHVEEYEIKTVLLHGRHVPDRDHPNRYNAFGTIPPNKKIWVVYTLVEPSDGTTVVVITAFED